MTYLRALIICVAGAICGFSNYDSWWCLILAIIASLGAIASVFMIYTEFHKWNK